MDPDHEYTLLLPFDNDDPMFVRGVEVGRLWEIVKGNAGTVRETIHASNAEMALRIGEACERNVHSVELGDDWLEVIYS